MLGPADDALEIIWLTADFTGNENAVRRQHSDRQIQPFSHMPAGIEKGITGRAVTFARELQGFRKLAAQMVKRHQSVIGHLVDHPDNPGT